MRGFAAALAKHVPWSGLFRVLQLRLGGKIPWLLLVPGAAVVLEFANSALSLQARLPLSFFLIFLMCLAFAVAHGCYAIGCPVDLKRLGSLDDWRTRQTENAKRLKEKVDGDKAVRTTIYQEAETKITGRLSSVGGKHAFTVEQIATIRRIFMETLKDETDPMKEYVGQLKAGTETRFHDLDGQASVWKFLCLLFVAAALGIAAALIAIRGYGVYTATFPG